MPIFDELGDRMKSHEAVETARRLDARESPVVARLDGRGFSKFTRGMDRPFDRRMMSCMQTATRHLVQNTGARIGYTQSDEITLVYSVDGDNPLEEMMFAGKLQKLTSVLASMATAAFTNAVMKQDASFKTYAERLPHFDGRVFSVPSRDEAANAVLWRTLDAERNAISMTAFANFSHKSLHGVSQAGMLEMLAEKGVAFNEYPRAFRFGSFYRRQTIERPLTEAERVLMPEAHRPEPGTLVKRTEVQRLDDMRSFRDVTNRVGVIFDGEDPLVAA